MDESTGDDRTAETHGRAWFRGSPHTNDYLCYRFGVRKENVRSGAFERTALNRFTGVYDRVNERSEVSHNLVVVEQTNSDPDHFRNQFHEPPLVRLYSPSVSNPLSPRLSPLSPTTTMVNSQSQRPTEKSGDLIFRLRDTSRTEFLSKSTYTAHRWPVISHPRLSRLCNRPHCRCG